MIDKNIFAEGMGQLGGAFGREIDEPVTRMYYAILSPVLTSEAFVAAVTNTVATERFWPSPAVILEKAGADIHAIAQRAFRVVVDGLNEHGGYRFLPASVSQSWDAATWAGIKAIGGLREITDCTERRWPGLVRDFCKAYTEALQPSKTLPHGQPQPQTKHLVARVVGSIGRDAQLPPGDRSE